MSAEMTTFAVVTTVEVEVGSIPELASLFDKTNRSLVARHADWLGAWFTANVAKSEVTVIARWADKESYAKFRSSEEFRHVMEQFSTTFVGPPVITVNEILVEM